MGEISRELIGKRYEAAEYEVTAGSIGDYAEATNDDNELYEGDDVSIAPPMFAVVPATKLLIGSLTDPELALPPDRTLHGEQDMYFTSPIVAGDALLTDVEVVDVSERSTGETVTFRIISRTKDGKERARSLATAFVRDPSRGKSSGAEQDRPDTSPVAEVTMKVAEDQPLRYAEASGDHNLPHVDEGFAKMIGFRTVILQGLCTMAFAGKAIVDEVCGGDPEKLSRLKVRFSKVVYPGDALTTRIWSEGDGSFTFETVNQDGGMVLKDGVAETR